eukprot:11649686-Ditylum_brightwellii.AAC.2
MPGWHVVTAASGWIGVKSMGKKWDITTRSTHRKIQGDLAGLGTGGAKGCKVGTPAENPTKNGAQGERAGAGYGTGPPVGANPTGAGPRLDTGWEPWLAQEPTARSRE